ncbi:MAG: Holliday junction resolvase RuvX [Clostridia bacterium]|nr:Holliday junction resolvase RuvX [Clostridia bacterium]
MVILAVDYGDARTGLAVCDRMEILASPVGVINESYEPKVIAAVKSHAERLGAELLVVGLPKNMDGSEGFRADKCKAFAEQLGNATGIKTVMYDERLTTVWAHRTLSDNNVRGKKRKEVVDAVSAVVILEGYMASKK